MIERTHSEKRLLEKLRDLRPSAGVLARCEDPERCAALYRGVLVRAALAIERGAVTMEALLDTALAAVPAPERALVHLDRFLEAAMSPSGMLTQFLRAPRLLTDFLILISSSHWLADALVRDAGLFRWLLASDVLEQSPTRAAFVEAAMGAKHRFDHADRRMDALRRFQRRELLRIAAADLLGRKPFPRVVADLSALADALLAAVLEEAVATVTRRRGEAVDARIAVIALGKLGGRELNYSSDIDLMIVHQPAHTGDPTQHDAVVAVVKEMLRLLTAHSAEGMLYRTDLRLRPDGAAGAPALSLDATLAYYERRGALWERQMLLRARPCAGDADLGAEFLHRIAPFVYPRTTLRPPSQLLADVQSRLAERWNADRDVKHMRGGIRHVEFSLQALQMLHAKNTAVRTPSTMAAIDALAAEGLLEPEEEALLRDAYVFLRRVEHAVQIDRFEQTHALPRHEAELQRLAWVLGFDSVDAFGQRLGRIQDNVIRICDGMLGAKDTAAEEETQVLPPSLARESRARPLLHDLIHGRSSAPRSTPERQRLRAVMPELLREIAASPLPLSAFACIEQFVAASGSRGGLAYLEHPDARRLLLRLAALAPVALGGLARDPLALELVFSGWEESRLDDARLQLVAGTSALASLLLGDGGMSAYGEALTRTADVILQRIIGRLHDGSFPFAVLAMGKYGSAELIPGSDLDVILLYSAVTPSAQESAQRLARALIADMRGGVVPPLYEVDARLRPEGRSAPLAVSVEAWRQYLAERASPWERQSLLRARVAFDTGGLGAEIDTVIRQQRAAYRSSRESVDRLRAMRLAMEPENRFRQADFIDIKKSAGGLVDAEFAAQQLQLADPDLPRGGTMEVLAEAGRHRQTIAPVVERLRGHYDRLRRMQLFLRLLVDTPSNLVPKEEQPRMLLAAALGFPGTTPMLDDLRERMAGARRDFEFILDTISSPTP